MSLGLEIDKRNVDILVGHKSRMLLRAMRLHARTKEPTFYEDTPDM